MTTFKIDHNHIFGDLAKLDRYFVGYDGMLKKMADAHTILGKSIPNYPPYNIAKIDDDKYVIEMAVAGFGKQNLDIEIANGTLTISGHTTVDDLVEEGLNLQYLYKGIADRPFSRQFNISDTIQIKNAELVNGMLKVWLENIIPDHMKPKKIDISDAQSKTEPPSTKKEFLTEGTKANVST
jgi:molecular chaperone IbpA